LARILIAEDEGSLANLYKLVLKKHGHEIIAVVPSGDELICAFKNARPKPDLVIFDLRLE
jgi:DNA-binding response OmpR family regulator